jgi:hypothetical protein
VNTTDIAIDPGRSGGISIRRGEEVVAYPMPDNDSDTLHLLQESIAQARGRSHSLRAFLEKVGGYVGQPQPGSAMFKFGESYGFVLGVLMALQVPVILVRPQKWQAALQLGKASSHPSKAAWKRHLRDEATRRFPQLRPTLATADSLLLLAAANTISPSLTEPCVVENEVEANPETNQGDTRKDKNEAK